MKRKDNLFNYVPVQRAKRNLFDLSHEVKMSGKFAYLYPIMTVDAMPGDTIREQATVFARFAPLLAPIMHRCNISVHSFFVPYRILTPLWEEFITGGQDGEEAPVLPFITPALIESTAGDAFTMWPGTLWDYLGLPTMDADTPIPAAYSTEQISALPFIAYLKIWNDYYRDPNLDDEIDLDGVGVTGNVSVAMLTAFGNDYLGNRSWLKNKAWRKDYFTSALPWAQRGEEVLMPLAGSGSVTYLPASNVQKSDGSAPIAGDILNTLVGLEGRIYSSNEGIGQNLRIVNIDDVNITNSEVSINDLRTALAIQSWMENNARGGGRYIEQIYTHYQVKVPDYRLQRAEYLGGGKQPITISEVLSTTATESTPVGAMAGHGVSVGNTNRFTYHCQEHGIVMTLLSCVPESSYVSQGIEKMWSKNNRFDHAFPELAHLGEQEILSKELFFSFDNADTTANNSVFGYIPRYAEYKFKNDRVAGDFRNTLDFWHLGRKFLMRPTLTGSFTTMLENGESGVNVLEDTFRRIFAVQDGTDYIWLQIFHRCTAKRPLPYFGVPRLIG